MPSDADLIYERALRVLPVHAQLTDDFFVASVPICVIDAVWSLGVRYENVQNVVRWYCERTGLPKLYDRNAFPAREAQESVSAFCERLQGFGPEAAANDLFCNRCRTSTKNGILKSDAVHRFATVLRDHGVEQLQDIPEAMRSEALEKAIRAVPGQASGISLAYFWMLAGSDNHVKPDTMVMRFMEESLGRKVKEKEALPLLTEVSSDLEGYNPHMTPRLLDHLIWKYQRNEPANLLRIPKLLALLPKLEAEGFVPYTLQGGEKDMVVGQTVPHVVFPSYHPTLMAIFRITEGVDPYAMLPGDPSGVEPVHVRRTCPCASRRE